MPIHDQGYRHYGGSRMPRGRAWAVITKAGLRTFVAKRVFLGLLLMAWLPFIARTIQIYAAVNFPQASMLAPTAETFRSFLDQQMPFVFFVSVFVGASLIAGDRQANALQIYLSKPLTRGEYVFGKFAVLATFLLAVTWLPAALLLLLQVALAGNFTFLENNIFLFPAITLFSLVEVTAVSVAMLALSSLSKSGRYVAVMYAAVSFFSHAMFGVLTASTGSTAMSWISYVANFAQLGDLIFRLPLRYATPWPVSLLMIVLLVAASGFILERRIRGVEVVT